MREKVFLKSMSFKKQKSPIHGVGIFSNKKIPCGKIFYIVPLHTIFSFPKKRCARISSNTFVSDEEVLNYVNHSCDPNSKIVIEEKRVALCSIKDIKENEEITLDYCQSEEKVNLIECKCKAPNCRNYFFIT